MTPPLWVWVRGLLLLAACWSRSALWVSVLLSWTATDYAVLSWRALRRRTTSSILVGQDSTAMREGQKIVLGRRTIWMGSTRLPFRLQLAAALTRDQVRKITRIAGGTVTYEGDE